MRRKVTYPARAAIALAALIAVALGTLGQAQEGPFTSESLSGTYVAFLGNNVRVHEPFPNRASSVLLHYPGDGSYHAVFTYMNQPGDPDDDGNPTRMLEIDPHDPSTFLHFNGTVVMASHGHFTLTSPFGDFHGVPRRVETIDGELTLVEYRLVYGPPAVDSGGLAISEHTRLVAEDILPVAPDTMNSDEAN